MFKKFTLIINKIQTSQSRKPFENFPKLVQQIKLDNGNNNKRSYYPRKIKCVIPTCLNAYENNLKRK
ncbi:hypothetical protein BpHYR1_044390 [Brachionus plicatilis]|uniref:Uncharacterized protein n=1 Tax=Brachionus plicatilis TaxID=10195 RepID=A0A3M7SVX5_BRAPC|nr:hypothetical protein BpHYR1_044390 [Brachionus plicatilis]